MRMPPKGMAVLNAVAAHAAKGCNRDNPPHRWASNLGEEHRWASQQWHPSAFDIGETLADGDVRQCHPSIFKVSCRMPGVERSEPPDSSCYILPLNCNTADAVLLWARICVWQRSLV